MHMSFLSWAIFYSEGMPLEKFFKKSCKQDVLKDDPELTLTYFMVR